MWQFNSLRLLMMFLYISHHIYANDELLKLLQLTAGVYIDQSLSVKYHVETTVLVTGYRLRMKFLVIAMDRMAYDYLRFNTSMISYYMGGTSTAGTEITTISQDFRSKQFNIITARKKEAVHDILMLGYNVLFSDTDVAMIRDPIPYMIWNNVDYVHSLNYMCKVGETWDFHRSKVEGNTGFYFVRSNNATIKLWADAYEAAPKYPRLDDQAVFWKVARMSKDPTILPLGTCRHFDHPDDLEKMKTYYTMSKKKYLISCMLDTCVFSSGMISRLYVPEFTYETLLSNLKRLNETICTLHANYVSGNKRKMNRMKEHGVWLATSMNDRINSSNHEKNIQLDYGRCLNYIPIESKQGYNKSYYAGL